jgi:hypothetical protein
MMRPAKWQRDICANANASGDACLDTRAHKDLNDWTRSGATREDLIAAMMNAEVIREAQMSRPLKMMLRAG